MGTYQANVRLRHASVNGPAVNTWHCRVGDLGDGVGLSGLADSLEALYNHFNDLYAGGTIADWDGLLHDVAGDHTVTDTGLAWSSTSGTSFPAAPSATAICINWKTLSGGRKGMGRTFVSPISNTVIDGDGSIATTPLGLVRTAAHDFCDANGEIVGAAWGVYSRTDSTLRDITSSAVRDSFAVLRSRRD